MRKTTGNYVIINGGFAASMLNYVCNKGNERIYVQSALALPTQEKIDQETNSLRRIDDGFQKIVVTGDHSLRSHDDHGILFINIYDFLNQ